MFELGIRAARRRQPTSGWAFIPFIPRIALFLCFFSPRKLIVSTSAYVPSDRLLIENPLGITRFCRMYHSVSFCYHACILRFHYGFFWTLKVSLTFIRTFRTNPSDLTHETPGMCTVKSGCNRINIYIYNAVVYIRLDRR
jgi:hypothetical protein